MLIKSFIAVLFGVTFFLNSAAAAEFSSVKYKNDTVFGFSDITKIFKGDGVSFRIRPNEDSKLQILYQYNGVEQSVYNGPVESGVSFELPGDNKYIYLEEKGPHVFEFQLETGEVFTRTIILDTHTEDKDSVPKLSKLDEKSSIRTSRFKLKENRFHQVNEIFSINTTRASGAEIFSSLSASVVLILAEDSIGSGAILTNNGHIITNWHVVSNSDTARIVTKPAGFQNVSLDENRIADVIMIDEEKDLAMLLLRKPIKNINPIQIQEDDFNIADEVHAIGHPKGNYWTYTKGVISQFRPNYEWVTGMGVIHKADVIQTQTPINPGNSGGPLLSDKGGLIGINSFVDTEGDGLNYAVAVTSVMDFITSGVSYKAAKKIPSEQTDEGTPFDLDEDGFDEGMAYDNNKNGIMDEYTLDNDKDGNTDIVYFDENENQVFELILEFIEYEGETIAILNFDEDEDGQVESIGYDFDMDGEIDKYEKA